MRRSTVSKVEPKSKIKLEFERYSLSSPSRKASKFSSISRRKSSLNDRPTPLDFDTFLPWLCLEMEIPENVIVTRKYQEKYSYSRPRSSSAKFKSIKNVKIDQEETEQCDARHGTFINDAVISKPITVAAYYNPNGYLVEVTIDGCYKKIHTKIVKAIGICVPFHSCLTKITFSKGFIHPLVIYEIGKLLPLSHITDVCLDGTKVFESNYNIILDQTSNLKYLSVSRCNIDDKLCNEIFSKLDYGCASEKSLMVLDLSSNEITDIGAKYIGIVLRKNRHLLHLNLAGNRIGDVGLDNILNHLKRFPLYYNEDVERKRRAFTYCSQKLEVYEKCLGEALKYHETSKSEIHSERRHNTHKKLKKVKKITVPMFGKSIVDIATRMTKEIVGEFIDPFDHESVVNIDGHMYCTGNFRLCSLNMAYNNLFAPSLSSIVDTLEYQSEIYVKPPNTGLIRINFEGNPLPPDCEELIIIETYLMKGITAQIPKSISSSPLLRRRSTFKNIKI